MLKALEKDFKKGSPVFDYIRNFVDRKRIIRELKEQVKRKEN